MATAPFSLFVDLPSVESAVRVSSTVTVTTSTAHGLTTGTYVQLEGFTGSAGTSMNGVFAATVTSGTTFTVTDSGTAGTASSGSAVVSRDLLSPLIDITSANRQAAAYAIPESITMSASGDGNASTFGFTVAQDDTPSTGPWWANIPDQARVRLYKTDTGTTPADADLYFIGIVSGINARLNGSGQGSIADISVDEVNAILDKLVVIGKEIGAINPTVDGFVRSGNVVTVTTAANNNFFAGLQVTIAGVNKGASQSFNGTFSVASASGKTFTYNQTGSNSTGNSWHTVTSAVLDGTGTKQSKQIVKLEFDGNHNMKSGDTLRLRNFVGATDKFTSQLNTTFSGKSMVVINAFTIKITMASPLLNVQTVTTLGQGIGLAKITPIGASTAQQNFGIDAGKSEDSAAQLALARINSYKEDDPAVQRLLNTSDTSQITGAGSGSSNSIGVTIPAGSLRSILDGVVEAYGGEDKKQRRYWIGLDRKLYFKLVDTTAKPTYANAPYKIITTGTQNTDTTAAAATVFPYSLSVNYDHNTVKSGLFNVSAESGAETSKVQSYTEAGYATRKGAPIFDDVVDYPTASKDPSGAVSRAARSYFLEQHTPLQSITFTLRGAGKAAHNNLGFSAGYYQTGASTFALQKRWEPGQWCSIECSELSLTGLYRVEQVNWGLTPGSFTQEITITANRRNPNSLTDIVKRRNK